MKAWKNWTDHEALPRFRREVPQGCGVTFGDDNPQYIDLKTRQLYDIEPRSIDEQEWWEANGARITAQQAATPRSSPPWTYVGPLFSFGSTTTAPNHYNYLASFVGVSVVPTTKNADICAYAGLQTTDRSTVFRTKLVHNYGDPIHTWNIFDEWYNAKTNTTFASTPTPWPPLAGAWALIVFQGAGQNWLIQSFRGNAGNTGPAMHRPPASAGLVLPLAQFATLKGLPLQQTFCNIEVPVPVGGGGEPGYACGDISVQAVFGHTIIEQNAFDFPPVNWAGTNLGLPNGGVTCSMNGTVVSG